MPIIKGPIKITGGFNAHSFLLTKLGDSDAVTLPFKATGWKSTKNPVVVEDDKAEAKLVDSKKEEVKEKAKKAVEKEVKKASIDRKKDGSVDEGFTDKFIKKVRSLGKKKTTRKVKVKGGK